MATIDSPEHVKAFLATFARRGSSEVDTARWYPAGSPETCEPRIGASGLQDKFVIGSKVMTGPHTKDNVLKDIDASLGDLNVKQIDIEYLHMPDRTTPFSQLCEAMDHAVGETKIRRWGLCNYTADEVTLIVKICEERGLIKPSVYQGPYNAAVRGAEKDLFRVLSDNGMSYYAYSSAAGGFFAGNPKGGRKGGKFDSSHSTGVFYSSMYVKPSVAAAVD